MARAECSLYIWRTWISPEKRPEGFVEFVPLSDGREGPYLLGLHLVSVTNICNTCLCSNP